MSASAAAKKLRILCMHGYRTNSVIMKDQTRGLRRALEPHAEFVFLDGPIEARGPSEDVIEKRYESHKPFYEWGMFKELPRKKRNGEDDVYDDQGWHHDYVDFDRMVEYMDEQLPRLGPFDAVLGFSQGAQTAAALSMWYLHKHNVQWWKCCVLVCAPRVRGVGLRHLFENLDGSPRRVPLPSVHILGKQDTLYQACYEMVDMFEDQPEGTPAMKFVYEHETGHRFPSGERHDELYDQVARLVRLHCGHQV